MCTENTLVIFIHAVFGWVLESRAAILITRVQLLAYSNTAFSQHLYQTTIGILAPFFTHKTREAFIRLSDAQVSLHNTVSEPLFDNNETLVGKRQGNDGSSTP